MNLHGTYCSLAVRKWQIGGEGVWTVTVFFLLKSVSENHASFSFHNANLLPLISFFDYLSIFYISIVIYSIVSERWLSFFQVSCMHCLSVSIDTVLWAGSFLVAFGFCGRILHSQLCRLVSSSSICGPGCWNHVRECVMVTRFLARARNWNS